MRYVREFAIVILIAALCFATWQCDRNKGKLNNIDAGDVRQRQISSVHAGRGAVTERETNLYPGIDRDLDGIKSQRGKIKAEERKPTPSRKDTENEVQKSTQDNIHALARLFVFAGYSCSVR